MLSRQLYYGKFAGMKTWQIYKLGIGHPTNCMQSVNINSNRIAHSVLYISWRDKLGWLLGLIKLKFVRFQPQNLLIESLLTFWLHAAAFFRVQLHTTMHNAFDHTSTHTHTHTCTHTQYVIPHAHTHTHTTHTHTHGTISIYPKPTQWVINSVNLCHVSLSM